MTTPESLEIEAQIRDFSAAVLRVDALRAQGNHAEADAAEPSREELINAVKAYRAHLTTNGKSAPRPPKEKKPAEEPPKPLSLSDLNTLMQDPLK